MPLVKDDPVVQLKKPSPEGFFFLENQNES